MSFPFLLLKIVIVALFLVMFLRTSKAIWGVGLLTVTTAILLDTLLSTFSREEILTEFGFFYYVIAGMLFAGAAFWMWGILRNWLPAAAANKGDSGLESPVKAETPILNSGSKDTVGTSFDRRDLVNQIHNRFGPDDLLDLAFDLELNENEIFVYGQDMYQTTQRIVDIAEEKKLTTQLALAVERILTPIPVDYLPRLEKLGSDSPATILRHFLIANYSMAELQHMCVALDIDWETIAGDNKKSKVRSLLLYLYRRNRIDELVVLMQSQPTRDGPQAEND